MMEAQEELALNKQTLETTINNVGQGIVMVDGDHKILAFNARFAEMAWLGLEYLASKPAWADTVRKSADEGWFGPDFDVEELIRTQPNVRTRAGSPMVYHHHRPDGVEFEITNQSLPNGGWVQSFTDITERKRAEAELADKEALLRTALESMSGGIFMIDEDFTIRLINDQLLEAYDISSEEIYVGASFVDFMRIRAERGDYGPGDPQQLLQERIQGYFENFTPVIEDRVKGDRIMEVRRSRIDRGGLVGATMDITERVGAEEKLLAANKIAEEAQARLLDAIESISEGFALFGADDRLILNNSHYMKLYDYSADEVGPGTSIAEVTALDYLKGVLAPEFASEETLRQRAEDFGKTQDTYDIPLADGKWLQVRDRPTSAGGTVSIHSDITERKLAEEVLEKARDDAEAAAQAKSDFVAVVSHEVRTPMNGVLGMARLLQDTPLNEEQQECVDTVVGSGEALLTIIDDLLDISKLEADKLQLETISFIATDVVDQSMAVMSARAEEKSLIFKYSIDPDLPAVLIGDPFRLRQVLLNLISNAIKFTEGGTITVGVKVKQAKDDVANIVFAVSDTGQGVSEENQSKLFSEYSQASVDVARKYGGTGLGLAICRRLVEMMGGEISLESELGKGSTFSFNAVFAIDVETDPADLRLGTSGDAAFLHANTGGLPSLRILQVEDNAINRLVAERILDRAGHEVVNANNGVEAMAMIESGERFDLILMDRHMPEMNGIETTRRIREIDGPVASVPIIGLTAGALERELEACRDAGMDEVLTKPVDTIELVSTMARLILGDESQNLLSAQLPVLVVDDTRVNRTVAKRQLAKLGIECDLAESGEAALELMNSNAYSIILTDITMPGMDGMELASRIRGSEAESVRQMPVIAMTGNASMEDRERYLGSGMDDVLVKPVVIEDLAAVLGRWLSKSATVVPEPAAKSAGPEGQSTAVPPIDLPALSKILGDEDEQSLLEMVSFFVEDFPELLSVLESAIESGVGENVRTAAHAAKSASRNSAAPVIADLMAELEKTGTEENWPYLRSLVDDAKAAFIEVEAFYNERVK